MAGSLGDCETSAEITFCSQVSPSAIMGMDKRKYSGRFQTEDLFHRDCGSQRLRAGEEQSVALGEDHRDSSSRNDAPQGGEAGG